MGRKNRTMRAPATQILSFTIILMYGLMLMASDAPLSSLFLFSPELLQEHGAADPRLIWQGETWRLFTAVFLHGGFLHLFFNVFVLRQIGPLLEPTLGSSRFLLLFLAVVGADSEQDNVTIQRIEKMIKNSKTYN